MNEIMESIIYWIIIAGLGVIVLVLIIKFLKTSMFYFSKMDISSVVMKPVKIPSDDIEMNAKLILPKYALDENDKPKNKLPLIFLNHGWNQNMDMMMLMEYAIP